MNIILILEPKKTPKLHETYHLISCQNLDGLRMTSIASYLALVTSSTRTSWEFYGHPSTFQLVRLVTQQQTPPKGGRCLVGSDQSLRKRLVHNLALQTNPNTNTSIHCTSHEIVWNWLNLRGEHQWGVVLGLLRCPLCFSQESVLSPLLITCTRTTYQWILEWHCLSLLSNWCSIVDPVPPAGEYSDLMQSDILPD